ncbi:hypothetical protein TNCV_506771 [Trichonephila clavipes]|nr:hypothetical protein TNCV_506771 [Trichonephila clavipes]
MPSPVQSNCDAHDTIENGQYGAVWSMGHIQQDDISVFCRRRTSNTTSPCRLLHIPVVLNDFYSRETTLIAEDEKREMEDIETEPAFKEVFSVLLNCPIVSLKEFVAVEDDNVCSIIADKGILELFQSSKNIIDTNSDNENKINNAAPVLCESSEMGNIIKSMRS